MKSYYTLISIVPNRFSEERICVGFLINLDGIPYFAVSDRKLNFAIHSFSNSLKSAIKKGFFYMDHDVNKIRRGEATLSLFDPPYAKRLLKELAHKKRGVVQYSDVEEFDFDRSKQSADAIFVALYEKFMGEPYVEKELKKKVLNFKSRVKAYISNRKFEDFDYNFKLSAESYPFIYKDIRVDLCRKTNYFTVFYSVDFSASLQTIQAKISQFRLIVQSLQQVSVNEGLSSGRYYVLYESTTVRDKMDLINRLKSEQNLGFKLIRLSEMLDKI